MAEAKAAVLARQIAQDQARSGLQAGSLFGSATQLRARYGVTEAMLRQAVLLLEEKGIAFSRRGVGGGIIIGAPDSSSAARTAAIYLQFQGATAELCELSTRANHWLTALSSKDGLSLATADYLRAEAARLAKINFASEAYRHLQLRTIIAASAGGAALALSTQVVNQLLLDLTVDTNVYRSTSERYRLYWEMTHKKLEAFIAGDVEASIRLHDENLSLVEREVQRSAQSEGEAERPLPQSRKAEWVVRAILRDMRNRGWVAGDRLGSEPQLMKAYGVSRPVIRQAVRLLELHRAAAMQRGAHGGLVISTPDAEYATQAMVKHLQEAGASCAQARNLRREILLRHVPEFLPGHIPHLEAAFRAMAKKMPSEFWATGASALTEICRGANNIVGLFLVNTLREFEYDHTEVQSPTDLDRHAALQALEAVVTSIVRKDSSRAQRAIIQYWMIEGRYIANR